MTSPTEPEGGAGGSGELRTSPPEVYFIAETAGVPLSLSGATLWGLAIALQEVCWLVDTWLAYCLDPD